ncbi:MAG: hypothetical protein AAFX52_11415 [Pseudomonadota bacterium]
MIAKTLTVVMAASLSLALAPTSAEAGHRRSGANFDLNFIVGGYAFPYGRHARFYGPGVVINPFVFPDGRVRLNFLRHGTLFATDYIGYIDYGRHGRVRGFYTFDGGYYDNSGRYFRRDRYRHDRYRHDGYRRYGYNDTYRRGYQYGQGWYDRDGRYHQRYDDRYDDRNDRRDRRRDDRNDRRDDRNDRRDDRYQDRDFRNEPYKDGAVPLGGIQSDEFPGRSGNRGVSGSTDLDDRLDG